MIDLKVELTNLVKIINNHTNDVRQGIEYLDKQLTLSISEQTENNQHHQNITTELKISTEQINSNVQALLQQLQLNPVLEKMEQSYQQVSKLVQILDTKGFENNIPNNKVEVSAQPAPGSYNFEEQYKLAIQAYNQKRYQESITISDLIVQHFSDHPQLAKIYMIIGYSYESLQQNQNAQRQYILVSQITNDPKLKQAAHNRLNKLNLPN